MADKPKRPRDMNQLAKSIVDEATQCDALAAADKPLVQGRAGGLKGGRARADALSSARRKEIAKEAALARWKKTTN